MAEAERKRSRGVPTGESFQITCEKRGYVALSGTVGRRRKIKNATTKGNEKIRTLK